MIQKRILFTPINGVGHVNASIGIAKYLLKRGHRIGFFIETTYEGKLKSKGFEEFYFEPSFFDEKINDDNNNPEENEYKNPGQSAAKWLVSKRILGKQENVYEQLKKMFEKPDPSMLNKRLRDMKKLSKAIDEFQPDLFVVDNSELSPIIDRSGKPWIKIISCAPLIFSKANVYPLPPALSGLTSDSDRNEWPKFRELTKTIHHNKEYNDFLEQNGFRRYPNDAMMPETEALTIYAYPEEYDYPEIHQYHPDWFNIEVFNKNGDFDEENFELKDYLPQSFYEDDLNGQWSGKWIYVSMGSMGSVDLDLMNRLSEILSHTNHKYIVSKGLRHTEYELTGVNQWGDGYLPQTKIITKVDLVITHGGNNTVTETFARGKPMIIMPLFADQFDNAVRLSEKNFAKYIKPYDFDDNQLIESIDQLLNDIDLNRRLQQASKRIQSLNKHEIVCDMIEKILQNHPKPNEND